MFESIKKFISRIPGIKIDKGYGLTIDSTVVVPEVIATKSIAKPLSKLSAKYKITDDVGLFELDTLIRDKSGSSKYKIRHIETGTIMVFPSSIFNIIFKSIPRGSDE